MHDLHLVSFLQHGRFPLRSADHSLIEFDRELLSLQTQTRDQFRERYIFLHLSRFAINVNKQELADLTGQAE